MGGFFFCGDKKNKKTQRDSTLIKIYFIVSSLINIIRPLDKLKTDYSKTSTTKITTTNDSRE